MKVYEAEVHYDDENGYPSEALFSVGAWDEHRALVLVLDQCSRHGITYPVVASLEVVAA